MSKNKGFTLVELLVVIATIALLMAVFILVLARLRRRAFRINCGTNLSQIGKAMYWYANDYNNDFPRAGGKDSVWQPKINNWLADDRFTAFNLQPDGTGGQASISSSLYLLVKYEQVTPKSFVCKSDSGTTEFRLSDYINDSNVELIDVWDFGPNPAKHCSYSYHMPYGPYPLTVASSRPGMAVAADRNPWIPTHAVKARDFSLFKWDGTTRQQKAGNAITHNQEGQNVLFLDSHVAFEKRPFCGINNDNIYTYWDGGDIRRGAVPVLDSQAAGRLDSLLVNDPPIDGQK
jgi:prepilin-type N-terminal cleavage/methylation domain-containing protein